MRPGVSSGSATIGPSASSSPVLRDRAREPCRRRPVVRTLAATVVLLATAACREDTPSRERAGSDGATADFPVRFELAALGNGSAIGTVTLTPVSETTTEVSIVVRGRNDDARRAGIHGGTCEDLGDRVKIPLEPVRARRSSTVIERSLTSLLGPDLVVAVSRPGGVGYAACGAIPDDPQERIDTG